MFDLHDPVTCARLEEGSWSGANSTKRFREARGDTGTGGSTRVVIDILSGASSASRSPICACSGWPDAATIRELPEVVHATTAARHFPFGLTINVCDVLTNPTRGASMVSTSADR